MPSKYRKEKKKLEDKLRKLDFQYESGQISKEEYVRGQYKQLNGRFREDVFKELDEKIEKSQKTRNIAATMLLLFGLIGVALFFADAGITGFATLNQDGLATLSVSENYTENSTEDLSFIQTDSLSASGDVYGHGETWIYLVSDGQRRLVYYADTRQDGGSAITGMVAAGSGLSETNSTNATDNQSSTTDNAATGQDGNGSINDTNTTESTVNFTGNYSNNETGSVSINDTGNFTDNATSNSTGNFTGNNTGNVTINGTNQTTSATGDGNQTNQTINQTASGNTALANETSTGGNAEANSTSNQTQETGNETTEVPFAPEIITDKETYAVGETVEVIIEPENSTYTLYLHSPSDTYIVQGDNFTTTETGEHTLSALVSKDNQTERVTKDFHVTTTSPTHSFSSQCVETCTMPSSEVRLEIVTSGTMLELNNVSYSPENQTQNTTTDNETANETSGQETRGQAGEQQTGGQGKEVSERRKCFRRNPNARPRSCFTDEEWNDKFPNRNFTLVNSEGSVMATVSEDGDMHVGGGLIENAEGNSLKYDYVVEGGGELAWIDAITKDLYVRGEVIENVETFEIDSKNDYPIVNSQGMYLAMFDDNGDLLLRGELNTGGGT